MTTFEFLFSLYGLLLGFSLTEVIGGFSRAVRARWRARGGHDQRLGSLTPMLATFLMLDIASFWMSAWSARDIIPLRTTSLFFGLAVTGLYFLAASWVFPDKDDKRADLDTHYFANRRPILLIVLICNLSVYIARFALAGQGFTNWGPVGFSVVATYFGALLLAIFARTSRVSASALTLLLLTYAVDAMT